jgi:hypothetical protein
MLRFGDGTLSFRGSAAIWKHLSDFTKSSLHPAVCDRELQCPVPEQFTPTGFEPRLDAPGLFRQSVRQSCWRACK